MEVGAVKQAFNNEVIHLKKNLNQAKIQIIHKLTRKAKTLNERKASDSLKEKLKRKAEAAVNEVLIIKKIKPRDVARFIVTHDGKLNDYLNKPTVDQNKACARLLLHKALQEKYKLIRERFGNVSINDLLMSRQERKKLKKEMQDKLKEKKKRKEQKSSKVSQVNDKLESSKATDESWDVEMIGNGVKSNSSDEVSDESDVSEEPEENNDISKDSIEKSDSDDGDEMTDDVQEAGKFVRPPDSIDDEIEEAEAVTQSDIVESPTKEKLVPKKVTQLENKSKKPDKRKENKNKNIKEKILKRNFNKKEENTPQVVKIVDPFFVTATGDNYMSLAEPRAPDEVKEEHKQGNRKYRRAVMFGHVPKSKPRNNNYENNSKFRQDKFNTNHNEGFSRINKNDKTNKYNNKYTKDKSIDNTVDEKPEKLHPSWEAKKKHSAILPFQGKKIVFDDS